MAVRQLSEARTRVVVGTGMRNEAPNLPLGRNDVGYRTQRVTGG